MNPIDSAWLVLKQQFEQCPECDAELESGNCPFCGWKRPLEGQAVGRDLNLLLPLMPGGGPIMNCPECGSDAVLELPIGSGDLGCISCGAQQYGDEWVS